jgi:ATP-dependent Clp protease protease subunit
MSNPSDIDFDRPHVELLGELSEERAADFIHQLRDVPEGSAPLLISVTTPGGDAEMARRILLDIERMRARSGRRLVFVGKTQCYSAGVTIMSGLSREGPVSDERLLAPDPLPSARPNDRDFRPMRDSLPLVEAVASQIRVGNRLEDEGFARLIEGSDIGLDEVIEKAPSNWYLSAEEALKRGLFADIVWRTEYQGHESEPCAGGVTGALSSPS